MSRRTWRVLGDRCIVCRRRAIAEMIVCKRHRNTRANLGYVRLPVIIEPKAFVLR